MVEIGDRSEWEVFRPKLEVLYDNNTERGGRPKYRCHSNAHAKKDTPRGDEAKTRRSNDGAWAKKGAKSYFGYKLHGAKDMDYGLIRRN